MRPRREYGMATQGAVVDPDLLKFQSQQKKSGTGLDGSRFQCSGMQWFWAVQSSLTFGVRCCCSLPSFRCRRVARLSPPWRLKVSFRLGASPAPARQLSYRSHHRGMPLGCGPHLVGLLCERFPALPLLRPNLLELSFSAFSESILQKPHCFGHLACCFQPGACLHCFQRVIAKCEGRRAWSAKSLPLSRWALFVVCSTTCKTSATLRSCFRYTYV